MKSAAATPGSAEAGSPIVRLSDAASGSAADHGGTDALQRPRAFAEPLRAGQRRDTGQDPLRHAEGVAAIMQGIGAPP
jgi:GTP pyrophosphokinase